ncbi:MAG: succinyl-diaminopimelate desuccinylase [Mangrovicoccus sp.]|nr:succinyl-diaminopimelate desuccinylase [Mangrovicoccus sp.]
MTPCDPIDLTARLIRCPSVTPEEGGALQLLQAELAAAGFDCTRVDRNGTANLYARWGAKGHGKSFGFNGHTDVVPVGDAAAWSADPFGAEIRGGMMMGRGATDMKSGVAAFAAAAIDFVQTTPPDGAVILAITGDEEGDATDGTVALLDWMEDQGEAMSLCLVGEPTCPATLGDMMKIGRRGSMNIFLTATGVQGHSAYLHKARNPVPAMARLVDRLSSEPLDQGTDHFDPSTVAVTSFDTGNTATNVVPAQCRAVINIRFNDAHSSASLTEWLQRHMDAVADETGITFEMRLRVSGESFVTAPGALSEMITRAVQAETGLTPEMSTTGGTSDARFMKNHCPVVEFGLVGRGMHQVDEAVAIDEIPVLKAIYGRILAEFFG